MEENEGLKRGWELRINGLIVNKSWPSLPPRLCQAFTPPSLQLLWVSIYVLGTVSTSHLGFQLIVPNRCLWEVLLLTIPRALFHSQAQWDPPGYLHRYCIWSSNLSLSGREPLIPPVVVCLFVSLRTEAAWVSVQTQQLLISLQRRAKENANESTFFSITVMWAISSRAHRGEKKLVGVILQSAAIKQLQKKRARWDDIIKRVPAKWWKTETIMEKFCLSHVSGWGRLPSPHCPACLSLYPRPIVTISVSFRLSCDELRLAVSNIPVLAPPYTSS